MVVAVQMAVANEGSNGVAMRTRGELELLCQGAPMVVVAVKALQLGHDWREPCENRQFYERGKERGRGGVREKSSKKERGKDREGRGQKRWGIAKFAV